MSSIDHDMATEAYSDQLEEIGNKIENLVDEALTLLEELEANDLLVQANSYWASHIKGAVAISYQSSSMISMADTIEDVRKIEADCDVAEGI